MKHSYIFLFTAIFSFLFCACSSKEEEVLKLDKFTLTYANVKQIRGKMFVGKSKNRVHGVALIGKNETFTLKSGEAIVTHDNGIKLSVTDQSVIKILQLFPVIVEGNAWIDFPKGISSEFYYKGWKIRAKGAACDLVVKNPLIKVLRGEILVEKNNKRIIVKEGSYLTLNDKAKVLPIKWWDGKKAAIEWAPSEQADLIPGSGVLGARKPGSKGKAYIPISISSMIVNVKIIDDMVITEVVQEFFNPTRDNLEGIYRFKSPKGSMVTAFAVDRDDKLAFGRIKGKELAKQQYSSNVYSGSREDPALLEMEAPNRYKAFIYPIKAGKKRKVLIRYTSWLPRYGVNRQIRHFSFPLVGSDGVSPEYEEFLLRVNLNLSRAKNAKANFNVADSPNKLEFIANDFKSTSDFHLILEDNGKDTKKAFGWYERPAGRKLPKVRRNDHVFIRLYPFVSKEELRRSLDLVLMVDVSADTSLAQLNMARLAVENIVLMLDKGDRISIVTGDLGIRKNHKFIEIGKGDPVKMLEILAAEKRGGATDMGELLRESANMFKDSAKGRAQVLLYVGNGRATVGELKPEILAKKWAQLPFSMSFRAIATEYGEGFEILNKLAPDHKPLILDKPGKLRKISDLITSFRVPRLKHLTVNVNSGMGKVYPRGEIEYEAGEDIVIVGVLEESNLPDEIILKGKLDGNNWSRTFKIDWLRSVFTKELSRRWALENLKQKRGEGASSEELMDIGLRYKLVTEYTSLYVPTKTEAEYDNLDLSQDDDETSLDTQNMDIEKSIQKEEKSGFVSDETEVKADTKKGGKYKKTKNLADFGKGNLGGDGDSSVSSTNKYSESKKRILTLDTVRVVNKPVKRKLRRKTYRKNRVISKKDKKVAPRSAPYKSAIRRTMSTGRRRIQKKPRGKLYSGTGGGYANRKKVYEKNIPSNGSKISGIQDLTSKLDGKPGKNIRRGLKNQFYGHSGSITANNIYINNLYICKDCKWARKPKPCSPASKLPLWQRRLFWKERLANIYPYKILEVYNDARKLCELPSPYSKRVFLRLSMGMLGNVRKLVKFYNLFVSRYGFYSLIRSTILAKIKTPGDFLYVKKMLRVSRGFIRSKVLEMIEKEEKGIKKIAIVKKFIDTGDTDPWLKIKLINLLEDYKKNVEANNFVKTLYGNALLDEELRLEAVEYLLRMKNIVDARRLLSEIVEFASKSPMRRKILGNLYRAFEWKKMAVREYKSYLSLTNENYESKLLLALAYEESNEFEKSLRLLKSIMTQGDPGSVIVKLARYYASAQLARLRIGAKPEQIKKYLARGSTMALFRNDEAVKILLTYKHPKSDIEFLWGEYDPGETSKLELLRVPFLKPSYGIEGIIAPKLPKSLKFKILRNNPKSRRILKVELLIIINEGKPNEKLIKKELKFEKGKEKYEFIFVNSVLSSK
jgi:tetratricopeptide (TPR) repeat protein